jgi:hypothetical protein
MADIHVIYATGSKPIVKNEAEFFSSGEPVFWCFHSDDDQIDSVELKFDDPRATFFAGKGRDPWGNEDPLVFRARMKNGRADFYGHVPAYPNETRPVLAKYTVRGLDAKGAPVEWTVVDPVIFTSKP